LNVSRLRKRRTKKEKGRKEKEDKGTATERNVVKLIKQIHKHEE